MKELRKKIPFVDGLQVFKEIKLSARAQLFFISLIALYYERERKKREGELSIDISESPILKYKIIVRDKEIRKKFNFKVDTIWRIREDLEKFPITIKLIKIFKRGVKYPYSYRFKKQFDHEFEYNFKIKSRNWNIINIPTSIIYDKDLTTKQKLSILWNISLKEKYGKLPRIKEIEKESGISEKTIRKTKKKYPQLFIKY